MTNPSTPSTPPVAFTRTGVVDVPRRAVPSDLLTVAAIAAIAYALANLLHEGVGHGGACLMVGGSPRHLTSVSFECDTSGLRPIASILVSASGTIVNLIAGGIAALLYARGVGRSSTARFFLWLFATVNLMQGFGYFLFSGVGRIGDWAAVMADVKPQWAWRLVLAAGGFALYWLTTARAMSALARWIGGEPRDRYPIALRLALTSYGAGALLYCISGALNPGGLVLLAISAAAASLGGTSGLTWGPQLLRGEREPSPANVPPARIPRDMRLLVVALLVGLTFIFVLGPGVRLG